MLALKDSSLIFTKKMLVKLSAFQTNTVFQDLEVHCFNKIIILLMLDTIFAVSLLDTKIPFNNRISDVSPRKTKFFPCDSTFILLSEFRL